MNFKRSEGRGRQSSLRISKDSKILTLGTYLYARGLMGDSLENAILLDKAMSKFSFAELRNLGTQLGASVSYVYEVLEDSKFKDCFVEPDEDMVQRAIKYTGYSSYVMANCITTVSVAPVLSKMNDDMGEVVNKIKYEDGVITVKAGENWVDRTQLIEECQTYCKSKDMNVSVVCPSKLEQYADKAFPNERTKEAFLKSSDKVVNNVSLVETAKMFSNGRLLGQAGKASVPVEVSGGLRSFLLSDSKELRVFHKSEDGVNRSGAVIEHSSVFIGHGLDTAGLKIKKEMNAAIIKELGFQGKMTEKDARDEFDALVLYGSQDPKVKVHYSPNWLAKEYSEIKKNKVKLSEFNTKYQNLGSFIPKYIGGGGFKYVLMKHSFKKNMPMEFFMTVPNIVDKLVGYYNLSSSLIAMPSIRASIDKFFSRTRDDLMKTLVMESMSLAFGTYEVPLQFVGIGKKIVTPWDTWNAQALGIDLPLVEKSDIVNEEEWRSEYVLLDNKYQGMEGVDTSFIDKQENPKTTNITIDKVKDPGLSESASIKNNLVAPKIKGNVPLIREVSDDMKLLIDEILKQPHFSDPGKLDRLMGDDRCKAFYRMFMKDMYADRIKGDLAYYFLDPKVPPNIEDKKAKDIIVPLSLVLGRFVTVDPNRTNEWLEANGHFWMEEDDGWNDGWGKDYDL